MILGIVMFLCMSMFRSEIEKNCEIFLGWVFMLIIVCFSFLSFVYCFVLKKKNEWRKEFKWFLVIFWGSVVINIKVISVFVVIFVLGCLCFWLFFVVKIKKNLCRVVDWVG